MSNEAITDPNEQAAQDEWLDQRAEQEVPEEGDKHGFRIESLDQAIRFAQSLHRHRVEQQEIIDATDHSIQALKAEIEVLEQWRDAQIEAIEESDCRFLAGALSLYGRERYRPDAKKDKNATTKLPFMTIKHKGGNLNTEVDNPELAVKWLKDNMPDLVRKTDPKPAEELPDLKAVLKAVGDGGSLLRKDDGTLARKEDGEIVEGLRVLRSDDEFLVEVEA